MSENRIGVADARALCDQGGKGWAVLIAGTEQDTQFVTWGRSPEQKLYAADLAKHLAGVLECGGTVMVREDFRLDAARNAARREELEAEVARLKAELEDAEDRIRDIGYEMREMDARADIDLSGD